MFRITILFLCIGLSLQTIDGDTGNRDDRQDRLEDIVESLVRRLDEKDSAIALLSQRVGQFEEQSIARAETASRVMKRYSDQINELTKIVHNQARRIDELEARVDERNRTSEQPVSDEGVSVKQAVKADRLEIIPKDENRHVQTGNRIQQRQVEFESLAFFATLTTLQTHLGVQQSIVFDRVVTNIGNAYNSHRGVFIAPVPGVYVFSATLISHIGHNSHFSYLKNGVVVSRMYVGGAGSSANYDTSSQTIVLQLAKGDDVSVVNTDADEHVWGDNYSSFSGFLLREIYDSAPAIGR